MIITNFDTLPGINASPKKYIPLKIAPGGPPSNPIYPIVVFRPISCQFVTLGT